MLAVNFGDAPNFQLAVAFGLFSNAELILICL